MHLHVYPLYPILYVCHSLSLSLFADNNTLLHFAARYALPQLFSLLLSFPGGTGALDLRDGEGKTPIDLARESNRTAVKAILDW